MFGRRKTLPPHYYKDDAVTLDRLERFATASREEQVTALARLHKEEADDSHTTELALVGIAFAFVTAFIVPEKVEMSGLPAAAQFVLSFLLGAGTVVLLLPAIISASRGTAKRTRAAVWARAYEAELTYRQAQLQREQQQQPKRGRFASLLWPWVERDQCTPRA